MQCDICHRVLLATQGVEVAGEVHCRVCLDLYITAALQPGTAAVLLTQNRQGIAVWQPVIIHERGEVYV